MSEFVGHILTDDENGAVCEVEVWTELDYSDTPAHLFLMYGGGQLGDFAYNQPHADEELHIAAQLLCESGRSEIQSPVLIEPEYRVIGDKWFEERFSSRVPFEQVLKIAQRSRLKGRDLGMNLGLIVGNNLRATTWFQEIFSSWYERAKAANYVERRVRSSWAQKATKTRRKDRSRAAQTRRENQLKAAQLSFL